MNRRQFLGVCGLAGLAPLALASPDKPVRGVSVVVDEAADSRIRKAARSIVEAAGSHPLLAAMQSSPVLTSSAKLAAGPPAGRAYNYLILVGLPEDPMIKAAWQREAKVEPGGLFIFGYGHLRGDLGYIESDRNPFLHGSAIASAPFETETVTITGSAVAGVELAARAFLDRGLINGVVAADGWSRGNRTLLDRDPLPSDFHPPAWLPAATGGFTRIGLTWATEDEYRGVLADTGTEPLEIWRAKYFRPGVWDGAGAIKAMDNYAAGLHRRAYGNTIWLARFSTLAEAQAAAPKIATAAKLTAQDNQWIGVQPPYANGTVPGEQPSSGSLKLAQRAEWLIMSTLPADVALPQ